MSMLGWFILGAVGASVPWMFAIAWFIDVVAAQRKALADTQVTLRLYRESRNDSDAQIRALLDQNERLARRLFDLKADAECAPVVTLPQAFCLARVES
jgi:hypothetical protein